MLPYCGDVTVSATEPSSISGMDSQECVNIVSMPVLYQAEARSL